MGLATEKKLKKSRGEEVHLIWFKLEPLYNIEILKIKRTTANKKCYFYANKRDFKYLFYN